MTQPFEAGPRLIDDALTKEPAFHSVSGLLRPPVTEWMLRRTFAAGRRGRSCGYVLLRVEVQRADHIQHGPGATDALLRHLGGEARDTLRAADAAGHLTDREILMFLPGESLSGAEAVAERIVERLDGASLSPSRTLRASAHPFEYTPDADSADAMLQAARRQRDEGADDHIR